MKGFGHLWKTKSVVTCLRTVQFSFHIRMLMGFRGYKSKYLASEGGLMQKNRLWGIPCDNFSI